MEFQVSLSSLSVSSYRTLSAPEPTGAIPQVVLVENRNSVPCGVSNSDVFAPAYEYVFCTCILPNV
jgi:hypothetical protein